jgi:hypothetical protein
LKRKLLSEQVRPIPIRENFYIDLYRRCLRWALDNQDSLRDIDPEIPKGVYNRPLAIIGSPCSQSRSNVEATGRSERVTPAGTS